MTEVVPDYLLICMINLVWLEWFIAWGKLADH